MRKNREFNPGATYHVTSRTNNKNRVFANYLGQKIMLLTLQAAKEKYRFKLHNFCIMPTHIHLLITPADGTNLSRIMQWIKTQSAKHWNRIHGSTDHFWGSRFFVRQTRELREYLAVHYYIDQNAVKAGLAPSAPEWKPSGAYHIAQNINSLVDFTFLGRQAYVKMLPPPKKVIDTFLDYPHPDYPLHAGYLFQGFLRNFLLRINDIEGIIIPVMVNEIHDIYLLFRQNGG